MSNYNLLDDFNLEEAATGELLIIAGKLSKWLLPMATLSIVVGFMYVVSGTVLFLDSPAIEMLFYTFLLLGQGGIWLNAARWQLKFIKWTRRVARYDTSYDQEHWIFLNFKLWQWLGMSLIISFLGIILLVATGF